MKKFSTIFIGLALVGTGCAKEQGPNTPQSTTKNFVFLMDNKAKEIQTFAFISGVFNPVAKVAVPSAKISKIVTNPAGTFAYLVDSGKNQIYSYAIDPTNGNLIHAGSVNTGKGPRHITFHPSGKFVYVSDSFASAHITAYQVAHDGTLTMIDAPIPFGNALNNDEPGGLTIDPNGNFLHVTDIGGVGTVNPHKRVLSYQIDAVGKLAVPPQETRTVALDPTNGTTLFETDLSGGLLLTSNGKFGFSPGMTGMATFAMNPSAVSSIDYIKHDNAGIGNKVAIDPQGRFLYSLTYADVSLFGIDLNTGALVPAGQYSPLGMNASEAVMSLSPSGEYLFVAHEASTLGAAPGLFALQLDAGTSSMKATGTIRVDAVTTDTVIFAVTAK